MRSRRRSTSSTFESVPRPDIMRWKYRKLLMNLYNALEALLGPGGWPERITRAIRSEGEAVLEAAGIEVAIAGRGRRAPRRPAQPGAGDGDRRRGGGSSWQSLSRAREHRDGLPERRDRAARAGSMASPPPRTPWSSGWRTRRRAKRRPRELLAPRTSSPSSGRSFRSARWQARCPCRQHAGHCRSPRNGRDIACSRVESRRRLATDSPHARRAGAFPGSSTETA